MTKRDSEKKYMGITVEDFGPIKKADVKLKPLTIFIGPNNSGKSYLAVLIYSFLHSFDRERPFILNEISPKLTSFNREDIEEDIEAVIYALDNDDEYNLPDELINKIKETSLNDFIRPLFSNKLISSFSSNLGSLIRIGKKQFIIEVESLARFSLTDKRKESLQVVKQLFTEETIKIRKNRNDILMARYPVEGRTPIKKIFPEYSVAPYILREVLEDCIFFTPGDSLYLPAAKSGFLTAYKQMAAGLIKEMPRMGVNGGKTSRLSGIIADFLSSIIELLPKKGELAPLAEAIEKELIGGEIFLEWADDIRLPEIKYRFKKMVIPLYRSSSTVSELASLFLYLKYLVEPENVLIIEEPEAHLHPANQRIMAKLLVRLIRAGVNVLITTHSDFLLEQLSNYIMLGNLTPETRKNRYNLNRDDYLTADEVSAYVFNLDKRNKAYQTKELEITPEDGISEEEFVQVNEALYNEMVLIRRDINEQKKKK